ncbi:MAG: indolepyruvate ferredoxin oxidoreductase subunit alpha [Clostridia bacterium]|nr:indolepyruvate ferredoxin oxidoreductase subunit alpha [Clostridia bacterium]
MMKKFLMGNEAIAHGALDAGVTFVSGYPGTPSTEVLECVAREKSADVYVEWSVNEKSALEIAAGASYSGARVMVTMKQVGLNVASDPLMSLEYIGIKGGMVIVVADDPGPISSQTEQDTRRFSQFSKVPLLDPATPEEAYEMTRDTFDISEKYRTPVIIRPTTRVSHSCADVTLRPAAAPQKGSGFVKGKEWVIFPRTSYLNHVRIAKRDVELAHEFSSYRYNTEEGEGRRAIATGGVPYLYTREALALLGQEQCKVFRVATPYPFPEAAALKFLESVDEVLIAEELDDTIEHYLIYLIGKYRLNVSVRGRADGFMPSAGELSTEIIKQKAAEFLEIKADTHEAAAPEELPVRPPVLCAGCPHRASFFAVKEAMKGRKAIFSGDIGCYTLGNAAPLDAVDTCLCMGAGITIAQGIHTIQPDSVNFAFIGDSTFFHTGIAGVVNAVYNDHDIVIVVLDNSTTAMTGHQPHPGTGRTVTGEVSEKISVYNVLSAIGVKCIKRADPLDLEAAKKAVIQAADFHGVSAVLFESPCAALFKSEKRCVVNDKCVGCRACINKLGCPAISFENSRAVIDVTLCSGCTLCTQVCPCGAIETEEA